MWPPALPSNNLIRQTYKRRICKAEAFCFALAIDAATVPRPMRHWQEASSGASGAPKHQDQEQEPLAGSMWPTTPSHNAD